MRRAAAGLATLLAVATAVAMPRPPVPRDNPLTAARVELGRRLFYDADLSIDGTMSCATCHEQHRGFADGNAVHPGVHGDPARRNVPGLADVAWRKAFTWGDPRIRSLEAQVLVPVLGEHPVEMGMKGQEDEIAQRLGHDACYRRMFAAAFPETKGRIDMPAIARALAGFERTLISRNAPYDHGPSTDPAARAGAALFARDCTRCHAGPDFTDDRYHRIIAATPKDAGLGEVTGKAADDGRFRTPSLRNLTVTQPYFHDGSAATIQAAIERHPGHRTAAEMAELQAFLITLTDVSFLHDERFGLPGEACGQRL